MSKYKTKYAYVVASLEGTYVVKQISKFDSTWGRDKHPTIQQCQTRCDQLNNKQWPKI